MTGDDLVFFFVSRSYIWCDQKSYCKSTLYSNCLDTLTIHVTFINMMSCFPPSISIHLKKKARQRAPNDQDISDPMEVPRGSRLP